MGSIQRTFLTVLQSSYVSHSNQRLIIFYFFDIISNNEIFIKKKI
jgi:hypothetical protein